MRRPSHETYCHCIVALGLWPFSLRCFRKRLGPTQPTPPARSRRGDVLPSHAPLPDLPEDGKLFGGGRQEGFAKEIKDGKVEFHYIDFQDEKNEALTKGYKSAAPR